MAATISWTSLSQWPCLVLLFLLTLISHSYANSNGCSAVKNAYRSKGLGNHKVPNEMISGEHLRFCTQGMTCCTLEMEHGLTSQSQADYDEIMGKKISLLRNTFISRTAKFDAFFTELLDNSKRDLHDMFVRTYGLLYQQNSHVFTNLFEDLRGYYKGHNINLLDALDTFFTTLLQKMFELLNAQYTFDEAYLQCVTERMDELKPFGDVPQKLSIQVRRAFIAARTFVQGLSVGRDVVLAISKIPPTQSCSSALMKMAYCPYCRGLPHVKACNNYCMNVMKGCLAYHADLNEEWNHYINALMKVAERLEGPFNIESVVDPIDVKISDAIMNFQENSDTVSQKIFTECGQPHFSRKKRASGSDMGTDTDFFIDWQQQRRQQYVRPTTAAGTSLDRLVRDIKQKVAIAKDFWKGLPHSYCNEVAAPVEDASNCWNGLDRSSYMPQVMKDGVLNQNNNPEVEVDVRRPNSVVNQQILQLKLVINKLKNAYNGLDVEWMDTAGSEGTYGSGSGSGSGSGDDRGRVADDGITFTQSTHRPPIIVTRQPHSQGDSGTSILQSTFILFALPLLVVLYGRRWNH